MKFEQYESPWNFGKSLGQGLLSLAGRFKDDEGLFQGGRKERTFGRLRDRLEGLPSVAEAAEMVESEKPRTSARRELEDTYYKKVVPLQDYVKSMNVNNPEDVKRFQELAGLKVDGIFGPASLKAMRGVQDGSYANIIMGGDFGFNRFPTGSGQYSDEVSPHIRRKAMNDQLSPEEVSEYNENISNASRLGYGSFPSM